MMTKEEAAAIKDGKPIAITTMSMHGTYENGVPFVREYPINIFLGQLDTIQLTYVIEYPDPLAEAKKGRPH